MLTLLYSKEERLQIEVLWQYRVASPTRELSIGISERTVSVASSSFVFPARKVLLLVTTDRPLLHPCMFSIYMLHVSNCRQVVNSIPYISFRIVSAHIALLPSTTTSNNPNLIDKKSAPTLRFQPSHFSPCRPSLTSTNIPPTPP